MPTQLYGQCDPAWSAVRDVVARHLATDETCGVAVAVVRAGATTVDLWGGYLDASRQRPWRPGTMVCLFSAGKAPAAALILKLVDRGLLDLDVPVAHYWPEFAAHGKETITVRQCLAHQAGIPALPDAPPSSIFDRAGLVRSVEQQRPLWGPGTQGCFHSFTYGILVSELVRRVTARSFGDCFRRELGAGLDGEVVFSLDEQEQGRCAEMILPRKNPLLQMMCDSRTELGRSWAPMDWGTLNSPNFRGSDFPSIAGHASALGLARFYGMMADGGELGGHRVLDSALVAEALSQHWNEFDPFMGAPVRMGLGFMLSNDVFRFTGGEFAFAQPGLGGVAGLGDRDLQLGMGVAVNLLSAGFENPFLDDLVEAVTACCR